MKTITKYLPLLLTGFVTCATCNTTIAGMSVTGMSVKSPMDESVSKRSPDSEKTYQPCKPAISSHNILVLESRIVDAATQGEKQFLYPVNGYLYPVYMPEPRFLESMPLQVAVKYLITGKEDIVVVKELVLPADLRTDKLMVEILENKKWKSLKNIHWHNGHFLAQQGNQPVWHALDPRVIRIRLDQQQ